MESSKYVRYTNERGFSLLGEGGNARVYLVKQISNGQFLAEKELRLPKRDLPNDLLIQKYILPTGNRRICNILDHYQEIPESVPGQIAFGSMTHFRGSVTNPRHNTTHLYLDYCECGDLFEVCQRYLDHNRLIPESFIFHVFKQVAEALAWLHWGYDATTSRIVRKDPNWRQVLHRDVKPENIFLTYRGDFTKRYPDVVLGDFGWACTSDNQPAMRQTRVGTAAYNPPEWCGPNPSYSTKGDVWCLGSIIHVLCTRGRSPIQSYPDDVRMGTAQQIWWDEHPGTREVEDMTEYSYSDKLNRCMQKALALGPKDRLDSLEMLEYLDEMMNMEPKAEFVWLPPWAAPVPSFVLRAAIQDSVQPQVVDIDRSSSPYARDDSLEGFAVTVVDEEMDVDGSSSPCAGNVCLNGFAVTVVDGER